MKYEVYASLRIEVCVTVNASSEEVAASIVEQMSDDELITCDDTEITSSCMSIEDVMKADE